MAHAGGGRRGAPADHHDLYSGLIRLHVLFHACEGPIFGLGMIEELARHGYHLSPGTMYPLLRSLEAKGLLRSERRLHEGRVRCLYEATPAGHEALKAAKQRVNELFGELFGHETTRSVSGHPSSALAPGAPGSRGPSLRDG